MNLKKLIKEKITHIKIRTFHLITTGISMILLGFTMFIILNLIFNFFAAEIARTASQSVQNMGFSEEVRLAINEAASGISPGFTLSIITALSLAMVLYYIFLDVLNVNLIIRPLEQIAHKANQVTEDRSKLGKQIEPPIFREMQAVTATFNNMSRELEAQVRNLENQVEERTRALKAAKENIEHLAYHDDLTGLPNRRLFNEHASQAVRRTQRNRTKFALLLIDLNHFKEINDTYGHLTGDRVLQCVANQFRHGLRESDLVARWGGDEFSILLFDIVNKPDVIKIVSRIFSAFSQPLQVDDQRFTIQLSIGATIFPNHGKTLQSLFENADTALYQAKKRGGPRSYQFFREEYHLSSPLIGK